MAIIETVSKLSEADAKAIYDLLDSHMLEQGYVWNPQPLDIVIRDGEQIVGGLRGTTQFGWLYIAQLALAADRRGQGWGRKLMNAAESIAVERGCHGIWLDTFSLQAPGFYRLLGYEEFGVLEKYPDHVQRHFFAKRLVATALDEQGSNAESGEKPPHLPSRQA